MSSPLSLPLSPQSTHVVRGVCIPLGRLAAGPLDAAEGHAVNIQAAAGFDGSGEHWNYAYWRKANKPHSLVCRERGSGCFHVPTQKWPTRFLPCFGSNASGIIKLLSCYGASSFALGPIPSGSRTHFNIWFFLMNMRGSGVVDVGEDLHGDRPLVRPWGRCSLGTGRENCALTGPKGGKGERVVPGPPSIRNGGSGLPPSSYWFP